IVTVTVVAVANSEIDDARASRQREWAATLVDRAKCGLVFTECQGVIRNIRARQNGHDRGTAGGVSDCECCAGGCAAAPARSRQLAAVHNRRTVISVGSSGES